MRKTSAYIALGLAYAPLLHQLNRHRHMPETTRLPSQVRLRLKFGGRMMRDGSVAPFKLADVIGARSRSLDAEYFLYRPRLLPSLLQDAKNRELVRDYLAQDVEADMGITDKIRFNATIKGFTEFCILGLHRFPELGPPATAPEMPAVGKLLLETRDLDALDEEAREQIRHFMVHGIDPDLALSRPEEFRTIMHQLFVFCTRGLHRTMKHRGG